MLQPLLYPLRGVLRDTNTAAMAAIESCSGSGVGTEVLEFLFCKC